jgi:NifB/MoaA-like Fe-S oxidoreductase
MLRSGEDVFLDDLSVSDVEKATGLKFTCADPTGEGLLQTLDECFPGVFKKKR